MGDNHNGMLSHTAVLESSGKPAAKGSLGEGNDAQHARDVRSAFAGVPKLRPQWTHKYMTILVVGESGLGEAALPPNSALGHAFCRKGGLRRRIDARATLQKRNLWNCGRLSWLDSAVVCLLLAFAAPATLHSSILNCIHGM